MSSVAQIEIAKIAGRPIQPSDFPNESFMLYSIPAYSNGKPESMLGEQIGSSKTLVTDGHVLFSKLNPRIPRVWLVGDSNGCRQICSTEFIPFKVRDNSLTDPEWLTYTLLSPQFMRPLQNIARSSTRSHQRVRPYDIANQSVPKIPMAEQCRIVARIKECMERVEEIEALRTESYNECSMMLRAYYHDLYRGLVQRYTMMPLADAGIATGGGTPSRKRDDFWNGDIPWISPKEMKRRDLFNATQNITKAAIEGSSIMLIKEPSVLFVVRGMILSHTLPVAVNRVPVTINQDMKAITPRDNIKVDFLAAMLRGSEHDLLSKVEVAGHGTRRLQTAHWSALPVPIISEQDQTAIVSEVQNMEAVADALMRDIEFGEIRLLRGSILSKAFAGEL